MAPHAHPFHELIVVLAGGLRVTSGGDQTLATAGEVLLYPAGVTHAEEADPDDPVESLFFAFRGPVPGTQGIGVIQDTDGRMRQLAHWVYADRMATDAPAQAVRRHLFHALWAEFCRGKRTPEPALRTKLRHRVRLHPGSRITVDLLADEAGLSRWHYIRTYRRLTGRTPMADVREERLDCARDWLLASSLPLKTIAQRTGLGSAQAFSRTFTARYGQPPAAFRRTRGGTQ